MRDLFYNRDWEQDAERQLATLQPADQKILKEVLRKKRAQGNTPRDLEKTARDIAIFQRRFFPGRALAKVALTELEGAYAQLFASAASYATIRDFSKHLRQFYQELQGDDYNPLKYRFMRGGKNMKRKKAQSLMGKPVLTQEEIEQLVRATADWRLKAYIMVSFDAMQRVGELLRVKRKDVFFKGKDTWLRIATTKEGANEVGLTFSQPYLAKWMALHPDPKPDQYLFCSRRINPKRYGIWSYTVLWNVLHALVERAGIKKRIHSHIFRRSGSNFWRKMGSPMSAIEDRGGWARGSMTLQETYLKTDLEASHDAVKSIISGKPVKREEPRFKSQVCINCQWPNEADIEYCFNCHQKLSVTEVAKEESRFSRLESEVAELKKRLLKEKLQRQKDREDRA